MKFCQIIEYNIRIIFLEKSYTKCGGDTASRQFSKKSKLSISLDQQSKVLDILFVFIVCQVEDYQNILKLQTTCFLTKLFQKTKKRVWNQSPCLISQQAMLTFCMVFEKKYFSCYIILPDQILLPSSLYFMRN